MSAILAVMTVIGFWNDVFGLRERFFPVKQVPIVLSSERIDLGSGTKKAINNFFVRNTGELDLYQVTIKLLLQSSVLSVTNDDIGFEMIDPPANAEIPSSISGDPFNQVLIANHGMVLPGRDLDNHEALWLLIYHLAPKATAGFRIRNQSFKSLSPGDHSLRASVAYYTNTLESTFMSDDGSPGVLSPSAGSLGMKSIGPGKARFIASAHVAPIEGADIVTNATYLMQTGKWDDAEKELARAIQRNPSLGVAYGNRATVSLMKGNIQDAYQDSVKALALLPDDALAYEHAAQCLRLLGRNEEALTNINRAVFLSATNGPTALYEKGLVLNALNRCVEARDAFDRSILLGYTNEAVRYGKAIAFLKENSISNAISEFNAALSMRPDMAEAYFWRGFAFVALGQQGMADRDVKEAIRLNPSLAKTLETMKKASQVSEDTARKLGDPQH